MQLELTYKFDSEEELRAFLDRNSTEATEVATKPKTTRTSKKTVEAAPVVEPAVTQPQVNQAANFGQSFSPSANPFANVTPAQQAQPVQPVMETHNVNTEAIKNELNSMLASLGTKGYTPNEVGQMFGTIFAELGINPGPVGNLPPEQMLAFYNRAKAVLNTLPAKSLV